VLDLFAGVGGLGLEALSRGAAHAVFVEKDRRHAQFLKKNVQSLNCEEQCSILTQPVDSLEKWHAAGPYDLVFMDPPYALSGLSSLLIKLQLSKVLAPGAILVFEHGPGEDVECPPELTLHSHRKLGPAGLSVFLYQAD
jgi:16S rRNA (guanine966-N2)-methyltransferase